MLSVQNCKEQVHTPAPHNGAAKDAVLIRTACSEARVINHLRMAENRFCSKTGEDTMGVGKSQRRRRATIQWGGGGTLLSSFPIPHFITIVSNKTFVLLHVGQGRPYTSNAQCVCALQLFWQEGQDLAHHHLHQPPSRELRAHSTRHSFRGPVCRQFAYTHPANELNRAVVWPPVDSWAARPVPISLSYNCRLKQ